MEGMERIASEKLAKLTLNSETDDAFTLIKHRKAQKLNEAKEIVNSTTLSADEKSNLIYNLLVSQAEKTKKLEIEAASIRKKIVNSQREKENLLSEINQHREVKIRIENYCRDIKKKNDAIIQECKEIEENEKKKLEEINEKMNKALQEINEKLEENESEKNRLAEENQNLLKQMEELRTQALARDQEFQNIIMEKNLEVQLLKVQVEYKTGFEENQLKSQVDLYKNRFQEFQSILDKSLEAHSMANAEIKKIDDKINSEKKENQELKKIKEKFDVELIQLFTNKKTIAEEITKLRNVHDYLKSECSRLLAAKKGK